MHYGSISIHISALFGALLLKAWSSVARDVSATTRSNMLFFHRSVAGTLVYPAEALILGTDLFRSQLIATKFCGQNGQSANAVRVACRRTLRRAARKVTLSSRSALPRKTASLFMRSINFLKLARARAKSSGAKRRCLFMRWTPTMIQARKESAQVGWISSVPAASSAVFQSASSNALSFKYDGICIQCSLRDSRTFILRTQSTTRGQLKVARECISYNDIVFENGKREAYCWLERR